MANSVNFHLDGFLNKHKRRFVLNHTVMIFVCYLLSFVELYSSWSLFTLICIEKISVI